MIQTCPRAQLLYDCTYKRYLEKDVHRRLPVIEKVALRLPGPGGRRKWELLLSGHGVSVWIGKCWKQVVVGGYLNSLDVINATELYA